MKPINEVMNEVIAQYPENTLDYEVEKFVDNICVLNIVNKNAPGSLLQVEIIYNDIPSCCVLKKVNVGRYSMVKFMNRLVEAL